MGLFSSKKPKVATLQTMPTTVTTGFGTGSYNPANGNVGYTLDPTLQQFRDVFYGASESFLPSEEQVAFANQVGDYGRGLFNTASNMDVGEMTRNYYQQQQNILAPERERESAQLQDSMFSTGRIGYGTGTTGGYINPQQYSLQMARENQNSQMLLGAEDRARNIQNQDLMRSLGLIDSSNALMMTPYEQSSSLFNTGAGIENLGMGTLNTVGQFAPLQLSWQGALQQNQQAKNNAKASGGFMSGLGGSLLNAGLSYATGGFSNALGASLGSSLGNWGSGLFTGGMGSATAMPGGVGKYDWQYSDASLKTNIRKIGEYKNGLNKYAYTYIWGQEGEGVIAQEAMAVVPKAVRYNNGFLEVNYNLIGD